MESGKTEAPACTRCVFVATDTQGIFCERFISRRNIVEARADPDGCGPTARWFRKDCDVVLD